jgi:hypothetical protein
MSYKREFNFIGKMENFVNVNEPYSQISDMKLPPPKFDFSHQSFQERCFFLVDVANKFKFKEYAYREKEKKEDQEDKDVDKEDNKSEENHKTTIQKKSDKILGEIKKKQNEITIHDAKVETELSGESTRISTLNNLQDNSRTAKNCSGYFHYRRGIYPFKTDLYEVVGYGDAVPFSEEDDDDEKPKPKKFMLKFEGGIKSSKLGHIKNDIVKLEGEKVDTFDVYVDCGVVNLGYLSPEKCKMTHIRNKYQDSDESLELDFEIDYVQRRRSGFVFHRLVEVQIWGKFKGNITTSDGEAYQVEDAFGYVQQSYLNW